jgi:chromosome segregation ATPase
MTRSNKMFEVMNNKIQDLEKSLNEQKNINEKLIKSINKTEEKHINLELAMEKMIAQIAQLDGKMNVLIDTLKTNNNNITRNAKSHTANDNTSFHDSNNTINNYQQQINNF